jgi:hypothetical protein
MGKINGIDNWLEKCEEIGKSWKLGSEESVVFRAMTFEEAVAIRDYMESHYADIEIFIEINGFVYSTEIRHLR